ncbi:hypothetical protein BD560DRAFT_395998 [Blakeslea trispora]|nr:hypothetical protein BD560DRAFT_395998 [Blakeslea trispora]
MSPSSPILNEKKQVKTIRDGLTDDEKRANHIVSEQKRRNTIRLGFKDLTELVPTLKNINNSKSTILFKAVDYIRYLNKRNKSLHDKLNALQLRIQMENKKNVAGRKEPSPLIPLKPASAGLSHHKFSRLPPDTINALLAHKQQQQQLEELQAQLHSQKRLLSKRLVFSHLQDSNNKNATIYRSISIPTTTNTSST